MSDNSNGGETGHGRPRRRSRGRKDEHGISKSGKRKVSESVAEMIDRLLLLPVLMTMNTEDHKVSSLQAIMFQISQKAYAGNLRAKRVLLLYRQFAQANSSKKLRLVFVESDYTHAVATPLGHDDE
jgi:hypothetical protein